MFGIEDIFKEPKQWGFRGDPFLWNELKHEVIEIGGFDSTEDFMLFIKRRFNEHINLRLFSEEGDLISENFPQQESIFIQKFAHGGMSSGYICLKWWVNYLLPLMREQYIEGSKLK